MSNDWVVHSWKVVQFDHMPQKEIAVLWEGEPGEGLTPVFYDLEGRVIFYPAYDAEDPPDVPQEILKEAIQRKAQPLDDTSTQGAFKF